MEVGPTRRVENLAAARPAIEVSAAGRVVMPGFIDCHTHLLHAGSAESAEEFNAGVRALRATTGMGLQRRARLYLDAMARHGTTTVEVKTGCGADEHAEMKVLRVLSDLQNEPLEIVPSFLFCPPESAERAITESAWRWACTEFLPKVRRRHRAAFADVAASASSTPPDYLSRFFRAARAVGIPCKMHAERAP
jgi:imidazolonepropionase